MQIKKLIKKIVYSKYYYEIQRRRLKTEFEEEIPYNIVFLVQRAEIFTSVMTVYEEMTKNEKCNIILVALPRYDHTAKDNKFLMESIEYNLNFCKSLPGKHLSISSYDTEMGKFINLEELSPRYVFLGLPYVHEYPKEYSFDRLCSFTEICYIPYGHFFADGRKMIENCFQRELLCSVSYLFCDCDKTSEYCKTKLRYCEKKRGKSIVYNVGFPRFDLIEPLKEKSQINTFLWLPRWTTSEDHNEKSSFLDYKDTLLEFFECHKNLRLIIRPHPLMFSNYVNKGILSEEDIHKFKNRITKSGNIVLDTNSTYLTSLNEADCLICDYTSIMIEFYIMNKPVIYLDKTEEMDMCVSEGLYLSNSPGNTFEIITSILSTGDTKFEMRKEKIEHLKDKDVGRKICNLLLNK